MGVFDVEFVDDEVWTTAEGDKLFVRNMTESHAKNALRVIIKRFRAYRAAVNGVRDIDMDFYDNMCDMEEAYFLSEGDR